MCGTGPVALAPSYLDLERQRDQPWDEVIAARGRTAAAEAEVARLNADVAFPAPRAFKDGEWYADEGRDFGLSANNLVNVAYGYKDSGARPYDKWDMRAAERAYAKLPAHRMTETVRLLLCEFRAALEARP